MNKSFLKFYTKSMKKLLSQDRAEKIKSDLQGCADVIVKNIECAKNNISVVFIDDLTNQEEVNKSIITPIMLTDEKCLNLETLQTKVVVFCNGEVLEASQVEDKLLRGFSILFLDGEEKALCFNTVHYAARTVEEPPTSAVIRGPREGFTETLKLNVCLLRKRLPNNNLKIEEFVLGSRTKTRVQMLYLNDLVDQKLLEKIRKKLNAIEIDGVIDSFYIAKFLEDRPNSIFRQVGSCEKPDVACAKMLEGRVAILVDGSPIAITIPFVIFEDFQSVNDYYWDDSHRVTLLRIIRVFGLFIAILFPGIYIAMQLYHYKILPLKFLTTIIITTQNLPLNPFLEVFFIIVLFDVLFEASIRMPRYLGMAISIVGALILGDTAVKAGLVSPPSVMIVAMSAITVYIIPNQSSQISTLRVVFAIIGGTLGFHGIILGMIFLMDYLSNIDCFDTPYLAPYAPYVNSDQKDFIVKDVLLKQKERPYSIPRNFTKNDRLKVKSNKKEVDK
jgi:spore germination protein KA